MSAKLMPNCTVCEHPEHLGRCDYPITKDWTVSVAPQYTDIVDTCGCTHIGERTIPNGPVYRRAAS